MVDQAPDIRNPDGSTYNSPGDVRCTRVGRFLRLISLDELPQLVNVLVGSMSLVGPRPDLVDQARLYGEDEWLRLQVKPGITGLAQINGRNALSWPARTRIDLEYVARQSLMLDLKILWRTVGYVLTRRDVFVSENRQAVWVQNSEAAK
jgi:lipopolysaccharide/colanic/teichoic acid biosynthesis glycosyltransferase